MGSAFIIVRGKNKQASQERVHAQEALQTLISLEKRAWKLPQGSHYLWRSITEHLSVASLIKRIADFIQVSVQEDEGKEIATVLLCQYGWFPNPGVFEPPGWRNQRMFLVAKGYSLQKKELCSLRLPQFLWFLPPDCCKGISDCLMGFSITEWLIFFK